MIRDPTIKKKLKKSRSDKILTMIRKIENQESFIMKENENNFIILPFNKKDKESNILKSIDTNAFSKFSKTKTENKENSNKHNLPLKLTKNEKKSGKANKVFTNDVYETGYLSHIMSQRNFLTDSIIKNGLSIRYKKNK